MTLGPANVEPTGRASFILRDYQAGDEDAAVALWLASWQAAYPALDFAARLDWWRARWRDELVPAATIIVATAGDDMIGFVTVDPRSCYLDQLVVAPQRWRCGIGAALIDAAKTISPAGLDLDVNVDNAPAIAFYRKHGFVVAGDGVNPISARPVHRMRWQR